MILTCKDKLFWLFKLTYLFFAKLDLEESGPRRVLVCDLSVVGNKKSLNAMYP